jgi:hypothetical protein
MKRPVTTYQRPARAQERVGQPLLVWANLEMADPDRTNLSDETYFSYRRNLSSLTSERLFTEGFGRLEHRQLERNAQQHNNLSRSGRHRFSPI